MKITQVLFRPEINIKLLRIRLNNLKIAPIWPRLVFQVSFLICHDNDPPCTLLILILYNQKSLCTSGQSGSLSMI